MYKRKMISVACAMLFSVMCQAGNDQMQQTIQHLQNQIQAVSDKLPVLLKTQSDKMNASILAQRNETIKSMSKMQLTLNNSIQHQQNLLQTNVRKLQSQINALQTEMNEKLAKLNEQILELSKSRSK